MPYEVWTVKGTKAEGIDGWFDDFEMEEEFDDIEEVKDFIRQHERDLYVSITKVIDPNGNEVDIDSLI